MEGQESYIIITGAAGFIGSCMAAHLNEKGFRNLVLVDAFGVEEKRRNWEQKGYAHVVERHNLFDWLKENEIKVDCFIHLGARTDTTEFDYAIHEELNVQYSKEAWHYCVQKNIPLIYASSAATYGAGELGYDDNHEVIDKLQPLNPYGVSKNEFDKWAIKQEQQPPCWAGLKFFNVYGPNEYHKGRMASVIWHSFNQVKKDGFVKLFKSHKPGFEDGRQLRDFIYVKDVVKVISWMMHRMENGEWSITYNGIYNLGTGKARTFEDLVKATFAGLGIPPDIRFVDMPEDIRDKYQYFTEANMQKLRTAGYEDDFYSLEDGIKDYVSRFLVSLAYY
jgi:ADP-L-glycero-D-manno-heptose 6-epimerase